MKKTIALILGGAVLCFSNALAITGTTVDWGAQISNGVGDASGTPLPNGSGDLILLGNFSLTNAQIIANGSNEAFLMSHFTTFASAAIGQGDPNGAGSASDGYWTAVSVNSTSGLSIQNTEVYYWVFNASTAGSATQYGIFTVPTGNANWVFPDDSGSAQHITTDLSQVPQDSSGILWGSYGTGTSRDTVSPLYNLAIVPEPSALVLAVLGLTCVPFAVRRRRRA
jgi:hypothetical protein